MGFLGRAAIQSRKKSSLPGSSKARFLCLPFPWLHPERAGAYYVEVVTKERGNLPAEFLPDLWQRGRDRFPIPLLWPHTPGGLASWRGLSCVLHLPRPGSASSRASARLSLGAAEESLNVTVQHTAN